MTGRKPNLQSWSSQRPNARGNWEAFVWMGTKASGKPDRRHVERRSRAARDKAVRELERQRSAGQAGKPGRPRTVEEMLTRHLEVVLPARRRAPRTIDDYASKCRNDIFPRWGGQRIDRLTPEMVEDGYAEMLAAGHAAGHVRKVHAILSSALEIEAQRGNIPRNPCSLVQPPALEHREMPSLSLPQARKVLAAIAEQPNAARWAVGLACGLRQGEALGLRWRYADLDAAELRVWYQLQRLTWRHGCGVAYDSPGAAAGVRTLSPKAPVTARRSARTAEPRTGAPAPVWPCGHKRGADCPARSGGGLLFREIKERRRKMVPLAPEVVALLRAHKAAQAADRLAAGSEWSDRGLVFCQPKGQPVDPRADWEEWAAILEAAGVPHSGTHSMRHSAATFALGERVGLAVVQELLGHSDIRVTRAYTHVSSPMAAEGAARVGRALFGGPET